MRPIHRMTILAPLVLSLSAPAHATSVLYTQAVEATGKALACNVTNVAKKSIHVAINIVTSDGAPYVSEGPTVVDAGHTLVVFSGIPGPAYCRFTVDASKSSVRAGYCVGDPCQASGEAH